MMIIIGLVLLSISVIGLTNANNMAMFIINVEDVKKFSEDERWSIGLLFFSLVIIVFGLIAG